MILNMVARDFESAGITVFHADSDRSSVPMQPSNAQFDTESRGTSQDASPHGRYSGWGMCLKQVSLAFRLISRSFDQGGESRRDFIEILYEDIS